MVTHNLFNLSHCYHSDVLNNLQFLLGVLSLCYSQRAGPIHSVVSILVSHSSVLVLFVAVLVLFLVGTNQR